MAFTSFTEMEAAAETAGSLGRAVIAREVEESGLSEADIRDRMERTLGVMREAVRSGLASTALSRSRLSGGDASRVSAFADGPVGTVFANAIAAALATAEVNASMGRIVAAPTGGASGVLPAVVLTIADDRGAADDAVVEALFCAAGIGGLFAARATLSGAVGGCQAEIGTASAMAAAATVELCGGSPRQAGHAAALAMQGLLGLVCDPVAGLVEVPCVHRNGTGVAVALAGVQMALAGIEFAIPLDEVVDASSWVGRSIPPSLRETSRGGLAVTPTAKELERSVSNPHP